jgi:sugar phosphate permease
MILSGTGLARKPSRIASSVDRPVSGMEDAMNDVTEQRGLDPLERETMHRVLWRLLPILVLGYFAAYLDRVNVGMAASTMNHQLGFSNAVFGFGAGLFFLGYFLGEIPSNLVLNVVGARRWLARIMLTWGIISCLTAFVWGEWSYYTVRILLGLAEAGFFPGVLLYMTWWFPSYYRSRVISIFYSASVVSTIIGPPISGLLLQLQGVAGLAGWQWLFVVEALPAIIMAFVFWNLLTDRPDKATWLREDQRVWLAERVASEMAQRESVRKFSLWQAFRNSSVWWLALAQIGHSGAIYGMLMFLPLIVQGLGVANSVTIGVVSAIPAAVAFVALLLWGWHSDKTGERTWHAAGGWLVGAAGLAACILLRGHPVLMMVFLTIAMSGAQSATAPYWSVPAALLTGTAAAGGFALIGAVGNLGGFFAPYVFGLVKDATGSDYIALLVLALFPLMAAITVVLAGHDRRMERIPRA